MGGSGLRVGAKLTEALAYRSRFKSAAYRFQVRVFVRRPPGALRFPHRLRQAFDDAMLRFVRGAGALRETLERLAQAGAGDRSRSGRAPPGAVPCAGTGSIVRLPACSRARARPRRAPAPRDTPDAERSRPRPALPAARSAGRRVACARPRRTRGAARRATGCRKRAWRDSIASFSSGALAPSASSRGTRTARGSGTAGISACARCTCSGRAGSASGAHSCAYSGGTTLSRCSSTSRTSLPGARPVRFATRKMCVSTAIVGCPNAVLRITFAVLRPTPGSASSASRDSGTLPPCCSSRMRHISMTFFAFVLYRPIVLMYSDRPAMPSLRIACGVFACLNRRAGREVDALVGRLRRQDHRDQQLERRAVLELGRRMRIERLAGARRSRRLSSCS